MSAAKPYNQFRALRPEYLALTDGNPCAALILDLFAYWTQVRRSYSEQSIDAGGEPNDLWFSRSLPAIGSDLYGAFGTAAIRSALALLAERGLIESRNDPIDPRNRTLQYRLVESSGDPLHDAEPHDGGGAKSNALARASDPQLRDLQQETNGVGDARTRSSVDCVDERLAEVVDILRSCPRLTFDPLLASVANALAAHPTLDAVKAARWVVMRASDPNWRTLDAGRSLWMAFDALARSDRGGVRPPAPPPAAAAGPVAVGWGRKYDIASGLVSA